VDYVRGPRRAVPAWVGGVLPQARRVLAEINDMRTLRWLLALLGGLLAAPLYAAVPSLLGDGSLDSLAGSLRGYLVQGLPNPLLETKTGWGRQERVANGLKWRGQGLHVHPEVQYALKNDGNWRKLTLTASNLPDTLVFDLRNFQQPPHGPATFDAFISFDARAEYERQTWSGGLRLYSGSTRARFRVRLRLNCEVTSRLEKNESLVPDVIFRLRVLHAELGYDNFVVEHVAGVGGELAKLLGDAAKGSLRFRPELERSLLDKANAAIVKAADTKEVRISLDKLLKR
jgi:hypothetical protein